MSTIEQNYRDGLLLLIGAVGDAIQDGDYEKVRETLHYWASPMTVDEALDCAAGLGEAIRNSS